MTESLADIWREYRPVNVGPGSVVIDLGSSEGYFARWAEAQGATVACYDARYDRAVGPFDGWCIVVGEGTAAYIEPIGPGIVHDFSGRPLPHFAPMISLTTILQRYDVVDFLKCDIEGGEYMIFDCDLSKVARFGIEFHVWTTPDKPVEGLGSHPDPMPPNAVGRLLAQLSRAHTLEINGDVESGGYIYGAWKQ